MMQWSKPIHQVRSLMPARLLTITAVVLVSVTIVQSGQPVSGDVKVLRDLQYGEVAGEKLLLDLYLPANAKGRLPAVILIHGGGWRGGDKRMMRFTANVLARRGYVVASVNYRLAPKYHYPAQLDDVQRAVRWLRMHADKYHVDPKRIAAWGSSAGGHLAALLGVRDARDNSDPKLSQYSARVQCVVDIFGPTDFISVPLGPIAHKLLIGFLGKSRDEALELWRDASPITHVSPDDAPFFIIHGTKDPLVPISQSERFAEALKRVGVEVTFVRVEGMGHGLGGMRNPKVREGMRKAFVGAIAFLDKHLKR